MKDPNDPSPPSLSKFTQSCSTAGVSKVEFSANKVVAGTTLVLELYDSTGTVVRSDSFTQNVKTYTYIGLPDDDYRLELATSKGSVAHEFTITCGASKCDLQATTVAVQTTSVTTGLGLLTLTVVTSYAPVQASGTVMLADGSTRPVTQALPTGPATWPALVPGSYDVVLTDAAGCQQPLKFVVPPPGIPGCMNPRALNYNAQATVSDNSCVFPATQVSGCMNPRARNYNPLATYDDDSCRFGPEEPVAYNYAGATSLGLVYNEPEKKWVTEQTNRPQMYMGLEGSNVLALPLPGQSSDAPGRQYLWEHNTGPEVFTAPGAARPAGILLYGRRHPLWVEIIILGAGAQTIKNLDNLVLVSNAELPTSLEISNVEQGNFTQTLVGGRNALTTVEREEQLTYVQLQAPEAAPWGNRVRAQYIRLRIYFGGTRQLRLSKLYAVLRESLT